MKIRGVVLEETGGELALMKSGDALRVILDLSSA